MTILHYVLSMLPLGLETLAKPFLALGYKDCGDYVLKSKNWLLNTLSIQIRFSLKYSSVN